MNFKPGTVVNSQQFLKQPQVSHNSQRIQTNQVIMTPIQGNPEIQQPIIVQNGKQGQGQIAYQVIQPQVIHGANSQPVFYATAPQLTQQGANGKVDAPQQQMQLISSQQRPTLVQLANGQTGFVSAPIQPQQSAYMLPLSYMMLPQQSSNNGNNKQQQLVAAPIIMQAPQQVNRSFICIFIMFKHSITRSLNKQILGTTPYKTVLLMLCAFVVIVGIFFS